MPYKRLYWTHILISLPFHFNHSEMFFSSHIYNANIMNNTCAKIILKKPIHGANFSNYNQLGPPFHRFYLRYAIQLIVYMGSSVDFHITRPPMTKMIVTKFERKHVKVIFPIPMPNVFITTLKDSSLCFFQTMDPINDRTNVIFTRNVNSFRHQTVSAQKFEFLATMISYINQL